MKWRNALKFAKGTKCHRALPTTKSGKGKMPADDRKADVRCKTKIRRGWGKDKCDGDCPGK